MKKRLDEAAENRAKERPKKGEGEHRRNQVYYDCY